MSKVFRPWKIDEVWLLPPSVADFVPAGHPAHLVRDLVSEELDLSAIMGAYTEVKGYPPYHPAMMVALLLYGYFEGGDVNLQGSFIPLARDRAEREATGDPAPVARRALSGQIRLHLSIPGHHRPVGDAASSLPSATRSPRFVARIRPGGGK